MLLQQMRGFLSTHTFLFTYFDILRKCFIHYVAQTGLEFTRSCLPNVPGIRGVHRHAYLPFLVSVYLSLFLASYLVSAPLFLLAPFGFSPYKVLRVVSTER